MTEHVVTTDLLESAPAATYFTTADRRIMIGLRACMEMLDLPLPEYATRKPTGRSATRAVRAAYDADHPRPRILAPYERKPNASPERIAECKARRAARLG